MTGTSYFLNEDEIRFLRGLQDRVTALERSSLSEVPVGALVDYAPQVRSARWSDSRREAVGALWSYRYQLNDFNTGGIAEDDSLDPTKNGVLKASVAESLPIQGQPGGLNSDGDYSVYFPGFNQSRIDLPLTLTKPSRWTIETIFKPEVLPQASTIFYIGTSGVNGFGMAIANGVEAGSGFKLIYLSPAGNIDTGVELKANQWFHSIFLANESDGRLYWYVSTLTEPEKRFSIVSGSAVQTPSTPTGSSTIGAATAGGSSLFKGWVDEVTTYTDQMSVGQTQGTLVDRLHTSLEPAAPFGFLRADGTPVSRSKYARLFRVLGTREGFGDGVNTFNLPQISPSRVLIRI